jgi:60 kDa SS-A/Ro ribonucleoprotein
MANKNIFKSAATTPVTPNTVNEAGGTAYSFSDEHALAQYVVTGCMNNVFYSTAEEQAATIIRLAQSVQPEFLAKLAVYAREKAFMKDSPALLLAVLSARDNTLFKKVAPKVLNNGKMVRNFVQIIRSGATGRKSLGNAPKNAILHYINAISDTELFRASVGNSPSMADIIKMVHPRPANETRAALYGYIIGSAKVEFSKLPQVVQDFENFKAKKTTEVPNVSFEMLTALNLTDADWIGIAKKASWTQTRMNLNTFARHNVFKDKGMIDLIADRLADKDLVKASKIFPYQLMAAYMNTESSSVPAKVRDALQDAMEHAIENVPEVDGKIYVFPDVSSSMYSSITGDRPGATSAVRCTDVAALVAASFLKKNSDTEIIPFDTRTHKTSLNSRDTVMTNAKKLASYGGGGTDCSAPLIALNSMAAKGDLVIYVSDNQSWINSNNGQTAALTEWKKFKGRNPQARLVCIDLQPYGNTQVPDDKSVMNIGGFSDTVFDLVSGFNKGGTTAEHWTNIINAVVI